jgi:hypothetical protein
MDQSDGHLTVELPPAPRDQIEARRVEEQALALLDEALRIIDTSRPAGDRVNRFLVCALTIKAAREIQASAEKDGLRLPMAGIVRSVLRSYTRATERLRSAVKPGLDRPSPRAVQEGILAGEIRPVHLLRPASPSTV